MAETTVTNLPILAIWIIAIAQILFAFSMLVVAIVLIKLFGQLMETVNMVNEMADDTKKHLPSMLGSVDTTLKNVKTISTDATNTVHSVTGTVNRVSHVVGSVAGRMESPVVKAAGMLTGVAAGVKALRGNEKKVVIEEKPKKGGPFGLFKK